MRHKSERAARWTGLVGICIASFLGCLDLTLINTMLPAIGQQFAMPLGATQWIASSFMVALSAFMVPAGVLADRLGRKKVLLFGLGLFGAASVVAGLATQPGVLVAARFAQGAACAALYTAAGAIVSYTFGAREQAKALGVLFGANGLGLALGPVVGGCLAGALNWRWAFWVNVPLVAISAWLCAWFTMERRAACRRRIDATGSLLLFVGLLLLVSGLSLDDQRLQWWLLASAPLALGLFARHEWNTPTPLMELHLFRNFTFCSASLATFFLAFTYCVVLLTLPMLLSSHFGKGEASIGWALLPATMSFALVSTWAGSSSERFGPSMIVLCGLILLALACALFIPAAGSGDVRWFLAPLVLFGTGWGAILGPTTLMALRVFSQEKAAVAMGTSWTVHNVGGASGIAFATFVIRQSHDFRTGFQVLMGLLAAIVITLSGVHWGLHRGVARVAPDQARG